MLTRYKLSLKGKKNPYIPHSILSLIYTKPHIRILLKTYLNQLQH